jgi:hypothetical protein
LGPKNGFFDMKSAIFGPKMGFFDVKSAVLGLFSYEMCLVWAGNGLF